MPSQEEVVPWGLVQVVPWAAAPSRLHAVGEELLLEKTWGALLKNRFSVRELGRGAMMYIGESRAVTPRS